MKIARLRSARYTQLTRREVATGSAGSVRAIIPTWNSGGKGGMPGLGASVQILPRSPSLQALR